MKKIVLITSLSLLATGLMSGCASQKYADVPAPTRFENAKQQQLQAANHWQVIAGHFSSQIAEDLKNRLPGKAVFIPQPGGEQPFVEGFRELLITSLVNQGIPVAVDAKNALPVDIRYSIYKFRPDRVASTYYYGDATVLAAGLWAVGGIVSAGTSAPTGVQMGAKLLTLAAGFEGFNWLNEKTTGRNQFTNAAVPQSEILLTATISDGGMIVSRQTNLYYATDTDRDLYWNRSSKGDTAVSIRVMGDGCSGDKPCSR